MGSWVRCKCKQLVHKNLFCGTGISLLVSEEFLDIDRSNATYDSLVTEIVVTSRKLLECQVCGRIIIVREGKDVYQIDFFKPDNA